MSVETATLLLVEDDPLIRTFLADNLTADGYELLVAATLEDALRELEFKRPDLAIVDLKLPGRLRARPDPARAGGGRRRLAARSGAAAADALRLAAATSTASAASSAALDDYVVKPFAYPELRLRIAAVLRRSQRARRSAGCCGWASSRSTRPARVDDAARAARRARREGVRAAADARLGADARVHEGGAAARRLGLPGARLDAHAGLPRLPPARRSCAPQGDQFVVNVWGVGYRLVDGPVESEAA